MAIEDPNTTAVLAAEIRALRQRQEQLERELRTLRAERPAPSQPDWSPALRAAEEPAAPEPVGRRHLLRTGLAVAGAAAATAAGAGLLSPGTAAADTGDALLLGHADNTTD